MTALALALTGCKPRTRIDLHYLPGFVPGSQNIFRPVKIAVPPTTGDFGSGDSSVGTIYAADGAPQTPLVVADAARAFNNGLIKGLADAGLAPVALDSNPGDGKPPEGSDFILTSDLEQLEVNKRFGTNQTVHGQYFSMRAVVRVKFELKNRDGAVLYSGEISGIENEPPNPVGAEVFLPLETEPAESLSVALSRAVGQLMLQPGFRDALPMRSVEAAPTSTPQSPGASHTP
ncbi:hypothetical protein [Candidatus Binatus soli]|jgi:hypothetical protein|uniref:hypothetical protein n=1 Tax=Candidatus Binatus soli TaxID=1953413 RepID=UPI003D0E6845